MIKNHFKHSQFIVVSLKEGMFQNANVIFRTKFVDGGTLTHHSMHFHCIFGLVQTCVALSQCRR